MDILIVISMIIIVGVSLYTVKIAYENEEIFEERIINLKKERIQLTEENNYLKQALMVAIDELNQVGRD